MPPDISGGDENFVDLFGDDQASENDTSDNDANYTDLSIGGKATRSTQEPDRLLVSDTKIRDCFKTNRRRKQYPLWIPSMVQSIYSPISIPIPKTHP